MWNNFRKRDWEMYCREITEPSKSLSEQKSSERAEGGGSFENEALENEDRSTKHPNLENEAPIENEAPKSRNQAPKNSKTKTPKLETGLSFINTRQSLANTAGIQHDNVRV